MQMKVIFTVALVTATAIAAGIAFWFGGVVWMIRVAIGFPLLLAALDFLVDALAYDLDRQINTMIRG